MKTAAVAKPTKPEREPFTRLARRSWMSPFLGSKLRSGFISLLCTISVALFFAGGAFAQVPWNWINSDTAQQQSGNVFPGGNLSSPPGATYPVYFTSASTLQRDLYWDFENPNFWQYPSQFSGTYDPTFANYPYDPSNPDSLIHTGCDNYIYDGAHQAIDPVNPANHVLDIPSGGLPSWKLNNLDNDNPIKYWWVQFNYLFGSPSINPPNVINLIQNSNPGLSLAGWANNPPLVNASGEYYGWGTVGFLFTITPNPPDETLGIWNLTGQDFYIDNLHMVTECVPEPATLTLLSLGGLALWWRRRS